MNDPETRRRTFTYDEACALLPEVRTRTAAAAAQVEVIEADVEAGRLRPEDGRQRTDEIVTAWANDLLARGIEVKGLWLVDFDNGSGYYCWKHPEPALQFFHGYEDGFRGRIRIQ